MYFVFLCFYINFLPKKQNKNSFRKLQLKSDYKFKLTSEQHVFIISMHGTLIFKGILSHL